MTFIHFNSEQEAFSRGGNRLCFVDPRDDNCCIKVIRPDRSPSIKKAEKRFPASLKPLQHFDDNLEEFKVYERIKQRIGEPAFQMIPRCYGFVDSNFGRGLCSELIKDSSGKISLTLKQYVWQFGNTTSLQAVLARFQQQWQSLGMPSRNLLLHNIVVQMHDKDIHRLVVIDGLGWPGLAPLSNFCQTMARRKAARKVSRVPKMITALLELKQRGGEWGYHGWMDENKRDKAL